MSDSTDPAATGADPGGWCHWHKGPSGTARVVAYAEQTSGPGHPLTACAPCREQRGLTAIDDDAAWTAWQAYAQHDYDCRECTVSRRCDVGQPLWDALRAARIAAVAS